MKKVVLSLAFVALMSVSCKEKEAEAPVTEVETEVVVPAEEVEVEAPVVDTLNTETPAVETPAAE